MQEEELIGDSGLDIADRRIGNERFLPMAGYTAAYWTPLLSMKVYVFGSRRNIQPTDIYALLYSDSRLDDNLYLYQTTILKDRVTLETMSNLII